MRYFLLVLGLFPIVTYSLAFNSTMHEETDVDNSVGEFSPTVYMQYADSADIYIKRQDWVKAENAIINALKAEPANPANPLLISNLGIVRNRLENFKGAVESFDIVLSRIPNSTVALTGRAEAYIGLRNTANAVEDLRSAIEADSTQTLPLTMYGYLMIKENNPVEAINTFDKLLKAHPESSIGHAGKADCLTTLGQHSEAIEEYSKALTKEERTEWRFRKGLLLLEGGNIEKAAEQARLMLAKDPRNGEAYILMALVHKKRFENREAETAAKMAREFGASTELIQHYIGK